jgi:hypothetical protein
VLSPFPKIFSTNWVMLAQVLTIFSALLMVEVLSLFALARAKRGQLAIASASEFNSGYLTMIPVGAL